ncbi:hypothetical protein BSNK01_31730 [Bacillaceae bacterium]
MAVLDQFDVDVYAISSDEPAELQKLKEELDKRFDRTITLLSDPRFQLIEKMDMRNGDVAYRGFGMLDADGNVVFTHVNDHWGEQFAKSLEIIKKGYEEVREKQKNDGLRSGGNACGRRSNV